MLKVVVKIPQRVCRRLVAVIAVSLPPFWIPEYSRIHGLRVSVLQKSADIIKAFKRLDAVFIALSGEGIRRLVRLISLTLFRGGREHGVSCNSFSVDWSNISTGFVSRFIKF